MTMPLPLRIGLLLAAAGGAVDLVAHASLDSPVTELLGHLVTLAGMVLAMTGVLVTALRTRGAAIFTDGAGHDPR